MNMQIKMPPPDPILGIRETLHALYAALRVRPSPDFRARAWELVKLTRTESMHAFVDELHRVAVYSPDPVRETIPPIPERPATFDADDACLFVAALAGIVGVPCKFVAARCGRHSWTAFLTYQGEDGLWSGIDVLRQRVGEVVIEEIVL